MHTPSHVRAAHADVIKLSKTQKSQKRNKLIADRRGQALADHMAVLLSSDNEVTIDGFTVHIDSVSVRADAGTVDLHGVVVTKDGALVGHHPVVVNGAEMILDGLDPSRVFHNPPLLFPDDNGDVDLGKRGKHRVDPAAVIINEIIEAAKRGGP